MYRYSNCKKATPLGIAHGKHVVTIEGLSLDDLTAIQKTFVDMGGTICGFCTLCFIITLTVSTYFNN